MCQAERVHHEARRRLHRLREAVVFYREAYLYEATGGRVGKPYKPRITDADVRRRLQSLEDALSAAQTWGPLVAAWGCCRPGVGDLRDLHVSDFYMLTGGELFDAIERADFKLLRKLAKYGGLTFPADLDTSTSETWEVFKASVQARATLA